MFSTSQIYDIFLIPPLNPFREEGGLSELDYGENVNNYDLI